MIESVLLSFRIVIATLFITTSISKLRNFTEHINIINNYKIIKGNVIKPFTYSTIILEFFSALFILLGFLQTLSLLILISLLFLYSLAISINLVKGRRDISCGCGGIVGDQHLSWFLVIRNAILFCLCFILISYKSKLGNIDYALSQHRWDYLFSLQFIIIVFASWTLILTSLTIIKLVSIRNKMKNLIGLE